MTRRERFEAFNSFFTEHVPAPQTELDYGNPFELLVAVVLSAQCTDKRINLVTPALVRDFPGPEHLSTASFEELFPYIKTVSYPNNKTRHLIGLGKKLVEDFGSAVPETIEQLQTLPGVGRKTANVIASVIYNQPAMAVDTHVFRVSRRLGLVTQTATTPLEVERQLVRFIPKEHIPKAHHWLILHGRYTCLARSPKCGECAIKHLCKYYEGMAKGSKTNFP